jgi:hypothetical protein
MDSNHQNWNQRQQELRKALKQADNFEQAIGLFLQQHAAVHTADVSGSDDWSFADEVWQGLDDALARRIPTGSEHSIAWLFWHLARIEDVTMNLLLAGQSQVWADGWQLRLNIAANDTGNGMKAEEIVQLSASIDLPALLAYRSAVGRQTRENVARLTFAQLQQPVDAARLVRVQAEGALLPAGTAVLDYWGSLTLAGLLLMPPTRHNFIHLNEALRLKRKK